MENKKADLPIIIRPYETGDFEACRALWVELTEWHRHIYQDPNIGGPAPGHYFDEHLDKVGPENLWVAEMEAQVVGLAGLIPVEEEAELEPLVVSERYRSLGIGRRLTQTVITEARGRGVHQLTVRPVARNGHAIRFFHAMGLDILGRIELFMDFGDEEEQKWMLGERLAGREFRV